MLTKSPYGVAIAFCLFFLLGAVGASRAAGFPDHPIKLIVPFPAGASTDGSARSIQPTLEKLLGQPVIIENRAGAGAVIGMEAVAKSPPDGYTIGIAPMGAAAINVSMRVDMPFDPRKDFAPITKLANSPFILVANPSFQAKTLRDVIAMAKASPNTIAIGHGGNGTAMHFTALLFTMMAGVKMPLVPYRGTAPAVTDAIGGHVPLAIADPSAAVPALQAKQVIPMAVSYKQRYFLLPDAPTFDEAGVPGFETVGWFGIVAPAGTPPDIVAKLNTAVNAVLKDPKLQARIHDLGGEPLPMSPDQFGKLVQSETDKWAKVIKEAHIPTVK
jgi:tripartite-type tricarboxylate transporter receptor subunit TctC